MTDLLQSSLTTEYKCQTRSDWCFCGLISQIWLSFLLLKYGLTYQILQSAEAVTMKFKVLTIPVTCSDSCNLPWHYFISIFVFQIKAYIHIIQVNFQHARNAYCFHIRAKFNLIFYCCAFATYCADAKLLKCSSALHVCFSAIGPLLALFLYSWHLSIEIGAILYHYTCFVCL